MSSETNRRQAQVALNVSFLRYRENGIDSNVRTDKCETVRRYTIRTGRVREAAVFLNLGGNTDEIFALSFSKLRAFLLLRKLCSLCNKKPPGDHTAAERRMLSATARRRRRLRFRAIFLVAVIKKKHIKGGSF